MWNNFKLLILTMGTHTCVTSHISFTIAYSYFLFRFTICTCRVFLASFNGQANVRRVIYDRK